MAPSLTALARSIRRFPAETDGIAAVEMAFIAPIALLLLSVGVAGGQSLTYYHKTVLIAHSVTDLVSRTPFSRDPNTAGAELLNQSDLDTDLALSAMIMYPHDPTNLSVVVSELLIDAANNRGKVVWSEAYNGGTKLSVGTYVQLDPSFMSAGATYMLLGQVSYSFQPLGGVLSLPTMTLNGSETLTIRNAKQITVNWGS